VENLIYRKCVLERSHGGLRRLQTAWIPESLAKVGTVLQVRVQDNDWDKGWVVTQIAMDPPESLGAMYWREWAPATP